MTLPFEYLPKPAAKKAGGYKSDRTFHRDVAEGRFPPPDYVNNRPLWRSDVLAAWLQEKAHAAEPDRQANAQKATQRGKQLRAARGQAA